MWLAQIDGLLAVARARERGEPWWMLDVRRAQARIAALRRGAAGLAIRLAELEKEQRNHWIC